MEFAQLFKHSFARTAVEYVAAVRAAHEPMATALQLTIRLSGRAIKMSRPSRPKNLSRST